MTDEGPTCECCGIPLRWRRVEQRWEDRYGDSDCPNPSGHRPSHEATLDALVLLFAAYLIADNYERQDECRRVGEALLTMSPTVTPVDVELCRIEAVAQVAMCGEYDVHFDSEF